MNCANVLSPILTPCSFDTAYLHLRHQRFMQDVFRNSNSIYYNWMGPTNVDYDADADTILDTNTTFASSFKSLIPILL